MDGLFAGRADGFAAGFEREGGLVRLGRAAFSSVMVIPIA